MNDIHRSKFWLVWSEHGGTASARCSSLIAARQAADSLAGKQPGIRFVVLEAIEARTSQAVTVERLVAPDYEPT